MVPLQPVMMKVLLLSFVSSLLTGVCIANPADAKRNGVRGRPRNWEATLQQPCTITKLEIEYEDRTSETSRECKLEDEDFKETGITFVKLNLPKDVGLFNGTSGHMTLFAEGSVINVNSAVLTVPSGKQITIGRHDGFARPGRKKLFDHGRGNDGKRALQTLSLSPRTVLALRVADASAEAPEASGATISDEIFGTNGDLINLKERSNSCSYGKTQMEPYTGTTPSGVSIANGVHEVQLSIDAFGTSRRIVKNAAIKAGSQALMLSNDSLRNLVDHVMLCLPLGTVNDSGGTGWIAYAYMPGWLSVYKNEWCTYVSAQVHEVGHNLGLGHSGEGKDVYGDQTGLMGYSYVGSSISMCFNPAKAWYLSWYSDKSEEIDFSQAQMVYQRSLVGIAHYAAAVEEKVYLKITGGNVLDIYVGLNRAIGINSNTQEARNLVTVTEQGTSIGSASNLLAKLGSYASFEVPSFLDSRSLHIVVGIIDIATNPSRGVADVEIFVEGCGPNDPCNPALYNSPCDITDFPSRSPTLSVAPSGTPSAPPSMAPSREPSAFPSISPGPTQSPTSAVSFDPTATPTLPPTASTTDSMTPSNVPTTSPSSPPSAGPSYAPSVSPSLSPTGVLTPGPSVSPTRPPTIQQLLADGFENDYINFDVGSSSVKVTPKEAFTGFQSLGIKRDNPNCFAQTRPNLLMATGFGQIKIQFHYRFNRGSRNDSFVVQLSKGGGSWATVQSFTYSDESWKFTGITTDFKSYAGLFQIRFLSTRIAKNNAAIYIDDVVIEGGTFI